METQPSPLGCYAIPTHTEARNLRFKLGNVDYTWGGGFGAIIKSYEKGVKPGDVRMIAGVPFYVYMVEDTTFSWIPFLKKQREVYWTIPNRHLSSEWIRNFKKVIFQD